MWIWDLTTGEPLAGPLTGHTSSWVSSVAIGEFAGTPVAVTGGSDETVRVWDLTTGRQDGGAMQGHTHAVTSVALGELNGAPIAVSGSQDNFVSGEQDNTVRVWDLASRREDGAPLPHPRPVRSVALGERDGAPIAITGSEDTTVRVWDLTTRELVGEAFTGHADTVHAVAFGVLNGVPVAVSASGDQTIRMWSLAAG